MLDPEPDQSHPMMRVVVFALLLFSATLAHASCVRVACYQVSGVVESCRALQRDGSSFLHLHIPQPDATNVACESPPSQPSTQLEIENGIQWYRRQSDYYIEGTAPACSRLQGSTFTGVGADLCCDTVPAVGACTLEGPLLIEN